MTGIPLASPFAMMPRLLCAFSMVVLMSLAAGCPPPQGSEGGACYPNETCDDGLTCASSLCVVLGDGDGDGDGGNGDGDGDAGDGDGDVGDGDGDVGDGDGDPDPDPGPDVPVDDSGFAVFDPVTEGDFQTQVIYISSSQGSNDNDGLSEGAPKLTLQAGMDLAREGYPDHVLLRRGDTWTSEHLVLRGNRGLSPEQPMLVSTFGPLTDPQPRILTGAGTGIEMDPTEFHQYIAIVDLYFEADARNPNSGSFDTGAPGFEDNNGLAGSTTGEHLYIEGNTFAWFKEGIVFRDATGGGLDRVTLRRNIVRDIYTFGSFSQGVYFYNVDHIVIEENIIDHSGRVESVDAEGSIFDHSLYLQNGDYGSNAIVRDNIITRGDGIQMREGGLAENNLFSRTWIALMCGGGNDATPGGVDCHLRNNVILDGDDINATDERGWGFRILNVDGNGTSELTNNIVAHNTNGNQPLPFTFEAFQTADNGEPPKIRNIEVAGNVVYNWGGFVEFRGEADAYSNVTLTDNILESASDRYVLVHQNSAQTAAFTTSGNRFWNSTGSADEVCAINYSSVPFTDWQSQTGDTTSQAAQTVFPDSGRDLGRYNEEVLGRANNSEDFYSQMREQRKGNWRPAYTASAVNDWIREGFGVTP